MERGGIKTVFIAADGAVGACLDGSMFCVVTTLMENPLSQAAQQASLCSSTPTETTWRHGIVACINGL